MHDTDMTHECTKMAQKWALLDFGEDHGLDIVETIHIEYPADKRWELSNKDFNFRDGAEVMYSTMRAGTGRKGKSSRYVAEVLKFGDTKSELKQALERAINRRPLDAADSPLGRGKRSITPSSKVLDQDDMEVEEMVPPKKAKKQKEKCGKDKEKAEAEEMINQLLAQKKHTARQDDTTETIARLKSETASLKEKINNLNAALATLQGLPALLKTVTELKEDLKTYKCTASSASKSSTSTTAATSPKHARVQSPLSAVPLPDKDLMSSDGTILLSKEKLSLLPTGNPRKMVNALLEEVFSLEELETHSLLGKSCNILKNKEMVQPALPKDKVKALRGLVCRTFPGYGDTDFNKHGREKLSNIQRKKNKHVEV